MKSSGFHGSYAPAIASLRSSRLFIHSLLTAVPALPVHGCRCIGTVATVVPIDGPDDFPHALQPAQSP